MAPEKAPAFQFYVKDWRSSRSIMRMTFAQRGMYLEMLLEQWESETLPDDPDQVADLIGGTKSEWRRAWPVLRRKFVTIDDRIQNTKLEEVRAGKRAFEEWSASAAVAGGKARAKTASRNASGKFQPAGNAGPSLLVQPPASSSATASASSSASATAIRGGGGRPLPGYRRLRIFRWMVEDLIATLGDYMPAFDLDNWLSEVDQDGSRVFPETWPWIKSEMLAECRARGYVIAEAESLGKQSTKLLSAVAGLSDRR